MKIKKNDTGSTDAPSTSLLLSFYFSVFLVLYIFFFFLRIVLLLPGWFTCTSSPLFHPHFSSRIYIHTYTPRTQLHSAMKVYIPSYTRSCAMAAQYSTSLSLLLYYPHIYHHSLSNLCRVIIESLCSPHSRGFPRGTRARGKFRERENDAHPHGQQVDEENKNKREEGRGGTRERTRHPG